MHRSRLGTVIIDCEGDDLDTATAFWSRALGYPPGEPGPPDDPRYRPLRAPPDEVQVELQRVDHASRVHIDIETDDIDAEVARLKELGATEVARVRGWCVMQAPSGHRFCVVAPQRRDFEQSANVWE